MRESRLFDRLWLHLAEKGGIVDSRKGMDGWMNGWLDKRYLVDGATQMVCREKESSRIESDTDRQAGEERISQNILFSVVSVSRSW